MVDGTKELWSYINIRSLDGAGLRFIGRQIKQSGETDLHISLHRTQLHFAPGFRYQNSPSIVALLAAKPRWKTVSFDLHYPEDLPSILFPIPSSLPRLRHFHATFTCVVVCSFANAIFKALATSPRLKTIGWHGKTTGGIIDHPFIHSNLVQVFGLRLSMFTHLSLHSILDHDFLSMLEKCSNLISIHILALYIPGYDSSLKIVNLRRLQHFRIGGLNTDRVLLLLHIRVPPMSQVSFGEAQIDLEPVQSFLACNSPIIHEFNVTLPKDSQKPCHFEAVEFCLRRTAQHLRRAGVFLISGKTRVAPAPYALPTTPFTLPHLSALTIKCFLHGEDPMHLPFLGKMQAPRLTHLMVEFPGPCLGDIALFVSRSQCPLLFIQSPLHIGDMDWLEAFLDAAPTVIWGQFYLDQVIPLLRRLVMTNTFGEYRFWRYLQSLYLLIDEEEAVGKERPPDIKIFTSVRPNTSITEGYAFFHSVADPDGILF
ncbi:hypothetical protein VNI00_018391 [Paramarasmius palmivorus]|uniref:Uncharacterized protein n=1 Tax=Paramarasmius palmivorus TaxID=297713 RepID=A0AAW0AXL3_9AGAR